MERLDKMFSEDLLNKVKEILDEGKKQVDEAVEVSHTRYLRSHGKKASGRGPWMFTHKLYGDAKGDDTFAAPSSAKSFSDATKHAKEWAKSKGHRTVYVMEEVEQIDEVGDTVRGRKALAKYINKAAIGVHNAAYIAGRKEGEKSGYDTENLTKGMKRQVGIHRASKRLSKEEVEQVDEAAFDAASKANDRHYEKQTERVKNMLDKYAMRGMSYRDAVKKISGPGHILRNEITPLREEAEDLDEMNYRDSGYQNMLKASIKADRIAAKDKARREKMEAQKKGKQEVEEEAGQIDEVAFDAACNEKLDDINESYSHLSTAELRQHAENAIKSGDKQKVRELTQEIKSRIEKKTGKSYVKPDKYSEKTVKDYERITGKKFPTRTEEVEQIDENAWNQLGQKKPVGNTLPAPAKGSVPKHGRKFSEGDHVVPHTGPYAGQVHRVTSSRAGSVNIVRPNTPKYDSITVRAKHEHLSPATPEQAAKYKAERAAEHKRMFSEGRGRPPKEGSEAWKRRQAAAEKGEDEGESEHIIASLRKASHNMTGRGAVKFKSGIEMVDREHARRAVSKYMDHRTPDEKDEYLDKISHSYGHLKKNI